MATLTWDAVGGHPAPGDPGAYDELARGFSQTASDAAEAKRKLESFSRGVDDSIWRGESARAFRDKIDQLPGRLQKLHASYEAASDGMAGYGRSLRDLQREARTLLSEAQDARHDQATQERGRDQAQAADPSAPTTHHDDAIAAARSRFTTASHRLDDLRDRRRTAENAAIAKLGEAGDLGIANDSWWKRTFDAIDNWVDEHADILREISEILKVVSAVAGVLSFIPGMGAIALVAGGLAIATDAVLAATGNGSWKTLLVDAAITATGLGAGRLIGAGIKGFKRARAARIPISAQKQAGHVKGTPQYLNRVKHGKPTSAFDDAASAERYTKEAWALGKKVKGRPGVKDHEFGSPVGTGPKGGTQSRVRVHMDKRGRIHGHPSGPETP